MGLTAFIVFVVPWMAAAVLLTRAPTALRLGAPAAPWRPLPEPWDVARQQHRDTHPHTPRSASSAGSAPQDIGGKGERPHGGALGPSMEPTEPTDKLS